MPSLGVAFRRVTSSLFVAALESNVFRSCMPRIWLPTLSIFVSCALPFRRGAAPCLLFQLWLTRNCRKNVQIFAFGFSKNTIDEADIPSGLPGGASQVPGDFFHVFLARQPPVLVKGALAYRKTNLALDKESSAKHFLFGCAESAYDVAACAGLAQGFVAFRSPSLDGDGDHTLLFSKKRLNASDCALPHANKLFGHRKGGDSCERKTRATIRHN